MSFAPQADKPILVATQRQNAALPIRERTEWSKENEPVQRIRIQDTTVV